MFVQYSFVHPRQEPMMIAERRPFTMSPSLVVATGLCSMVVTACAFMLS
jgi:hypothetical protein